MKWTADQIEEFRSKFSDGAIYADRIMRPMAEIFCPDVLRTHDRDWNDSDTPLGPNWHTFASDLERAIIEEHGSGNSKKLIDYYTFFELVPVRKKILLAPRNYSDTI